MKKSCLRCEKAHDCTKYAEGKKNINPKEYTKLKDKSESIANACIEYKPLNL